MDDITDQIAALVYEWIAQGDTDAMTGFIDGYLAAIEARAAGKEPEYRIMNLIEQSGVAPSCIPEPRR